MDNIRPILFALLAVVLFLLYQAWQEDYGPQPLPPTQPSTVESTVPDVPSTAPDVPSPASPATPAGPASDTRSPATGSRIVRVNNDAATLEIYTLGGSIVSAKLPQMPLSLDNPDVVKQLLTTDPFRYYVAESGLIGSDDNLAPKHDKAIYTAEKTDYALADGQDSLRVTLTWSNGQGVEVSKHFTFKRGLYDVIVEHEVTNNSGQTWSGREYQQLKRSSFKEETDSMFMVFYTGAGIYTAEDKFDKYDFEELQETTINKETTGGWISYLQHYFVGAWIPPADQPQRYYTRALQDERYVIGLISPQRAIPAGQSDSFSTRLFLGPKLQDEMAQTAPGLQLTVRLYDNA